jgi:hypothetical protein
MSSELLQLVEAQSQPHEQETNNLIKALILRYENVKGIYGYRLMKLAGIQSVIRRKKK